MLDLSRSGLRQFLQGKSPALRGAVGAQEAAEPWTVDNHPDVRSGLAALGRALECESLFEQLMTEASAMDRLRVILVYVRSALRLRVLEHLAQHDRGDDNVGVALISANGSVPPDSDAAREAVRILEQSVRHLNAKRLLGEIFSRANIALLNRALDKLDAN